MSNKNQANRSGDYRSNLETLTAKLLDEHNLDYEYETVKLPFFVRVRGGVCKACNDGDVFQSRTYIPDFVLGPVDGRYYVEAKGILSASERTKFLGILASHPGIKIYFVFGSNNKLNKHKDVRYSDWCDKHGFEYGIKELPAGLIARATP